MSPDDKAHDDDARGWAATEKARLDDEIERIERLDAAELESELHASGLDVTRADTVFAKAAARASLSVPGATPASSPTPDAAPAPSPLSAPAAPSAPVAPSRPSRRIVEPPRTRKTSAWVPLLIAAAFGTAVVLTMRDPFDGGAGAAPTEEEERAIAAELRRDGLAACDAQAWDVCQAKLDDARRHDPDGEAEPRVQAARAHLAAARAPKPH